MPVDGTAELRHAQRVQRLACRLHVDAYGPVVYGLCGHGDSRTLHGLVRSWVPHLATGLRKGVTAWNPGTWDRSLNGIMRALPGSLWCTIECAHNDYATRAAVKRSTWPEREIHLVHGCPSDGVATGVEAAMRVGYGYATHDGPDGNPWDSFRG